MIDERTRVTPVTKIVAIQAGGRGPIREQVGSWDDLEKCLRELPAGKFILLKYENKRVSYAVCEKGEKQ